MELWNVHHYEGFMRHFSGLSRRGRRGYPTEMAGFFPEWKGFFKMEILAGFGVSGFVGEVVFFYFSVEGGESDIKETGGFGLIAFGVIEDPLDVEFFHAGQVEG